MECSLLTESCSIQTSKKGVNKQRRGINLGWRSPVTPAIFAPHPQTESVVWAKTIKIWLCTEGNTALSSTQAIIILQEAWFKVSQNDYWWGLNPDLWTGSWPPWPLGPPTCLINSLLTAFFSVCRRVMGCASASPCTCLLLNLLTQTLMSHWRMMTKKKRKKKPRRTSRTGHQWVHQYAHCLLFLLSPVFLSVQKDNDLYWYPGRGGGQYLNTPRDTLLQEKVSKWTSEEAASLHFFSVEWKKHELSVREAGLRHKKVTKIKRKEKI